MLASTLHSYAFCIAQRRTATFTAAAVVLSSSSSSAAAHARPVRNHPHPARAGRRLNETHCTYSPFRTVPARGRRFLPAIYILPTPHVKNGFPKSSSPISKNSRTNHTTNGPLPHSPVDGVYANDRIFFHSIEVQIKLIFTISITYKEQYKYRTRVRGIE